MNCGHRNYLLVDDDEIFCRAFASSARKKSVNLDFISNPMDLMSVASQATNNHKYDVVLIDINLGENISGLDCVGYLEGVFSLARVFLISSCDHDKSRMHDNEFLSKKIGIEKMLKRTYSD